jgi:hypothetical protein
VLPLAWWLAAAGLPPPPDLPRQFAMWGARAAFDGSSAPVGEAMLAALEQSPLLRLPPYLLSMEQYTSPIVDRFRALGGTITSGLHLGEILHAMRQSVVCLTGPQFMGPTLTEAIFEDCAPLVWARYRALFPKLCDAAAKHGLLIEHEGQVRAVMERIVSDWQMRAEFVDSCKFAFADNSPERCLAAWCALEAQCGIA